MAKTILIADDDKGILVMMESVLAGRGYKVVTANNGEQAVKAAQRVSPDLIILDVQMPKMDGDEAAMVLKEDEATSRIPVLFCTGLRTDKEIAEAREENIFAKPVHFDLLLEKIKSILGE
ncbi:MAG TPA: response regulator [Candidatus Eisenbacteria bacterium]|nr:response regulator [Candidatus Eisenbacteria bacterium]